MKLALMLSATAAAAVLATTTTHAGLSINSANNPTAVFGRVQDAHGKDQNVVEATHSQHHALRSQNLERRTMNAGSVESVGHLDEMLDSGSFSGQVLEGSTSLAAVSHDSETRSGGEHLTTPPLLTGHGQVAASQNVQLALQTPKRGKPRMDDAKPQRFRPGRPKGSPYMDPTKVGLELSQDDLEFWREWQGRRIRPDTDPFTVHRITRLRTAYRNHNMRNSKRAQVLQTSEYRELDWLLLQHSRKKGRLTAKAERLRMLQEQEAAKRTTTDKQRAVDTSDAGGAPGDPSISAGAQSSTAKATAPRSPDSQPPSVDATNATRQHVPSSIRQSPARQPGLSSAAPSAALDQAPSPAAASEDYWEWLNKQSLF